jgi:hypothetical protein
MVCLPLVVTLLELCGTTVQAARFCGDYAEAYRLVVEWLDDETLMHDVANVHSVLEVFAGVESGRGNHQRALRLGIELDPASKDAQRALAATLLLLRKFEQLEALLMLRSAPEKEWTAEDVKTAFSRVRATLDMKDLGHCDLVIEAATENKPDSMSTFVSLDRPKSLLKRRCHSASAMVPASGCAVTSTRIASAMRVVEVAIRGMLPKTRLGRQMARKLHVYRGADHPHGAQAPAPLRLGDVPGRAPSGKEGSAHCGNPGRHRHRWHLHPSCRGR